jgi:outer membrane biosynthesis protein TonB
MNIKRLGITEPLSRILLIIIIVFSGVVMFAVNEIDKIVNIQLYQYKLTFSYDWATPYWNLTNIIYISLATTMTISAALLLLGLIKPKEPAQTNLNIKTEPPKPPQPIQPQPQPILTQAQPKTQTQSQTQNKTPPAPAPTPAPAITKQQVKLEQAEEEKPKPAKKASTANRNTCPTCKKTFTQPLVMLDFENGKSKLVNVCPYCNQVLGDADQKNE